MSLNSDPDSVVAFIKSCAHPHLLNNALNIYHAPNTTHPMTPKIYTALLQACKKGGQLKHTEQIITDMKKHNVAMNDNNLTVLINICAETGNSIGARFVLEQAVVQDLPLNNIDCVQLIKAFTRENNVQDSSSGVEALLEYMKKNNIEPDEITFSSLIKFCARTRNIHLGQRLQDQIRKTIPRPSLQLQTTLISFYAKTGRVQRARTLFDEVRKSKYTKPDAPLWNTMITACANNGLEREALALFEDMQTTIVPTEV